MVLWIIGLILLKHITDLQVRHMMLQVLAWLWCIAFSLYFASWFIFGLTVVSHFILILAIVVTVATFKVSENVYRFKTGLSFNDRQRGHVYYRDVHGNVISALFKNDKVVNMINHVMSISIFVLLRYILHM